MLYRLKSDSIVKQFNDVTIITSLKKINQKLLNESGAFFLRALT